MSEWDLEGAKKARGLLEEDLTINAARMNPDLRVLLDCASRLLAGMFHMMTGEELSRGVWTLPLSYVIRVERTIYDWRATSRVDDMEALTAELQETIDATIEWLLSPDDPGPVDEKSSTEP